MVQPAIKRELSSLVLVEVQIVTDAVVWSSCSSESALTVKCFSVLFTCSLLMAAFVSLLVVWFPGSRTTLTVPTQSPVLWCPVCSICTMKDLYYYFSMGGSLSSSFQMCVCLCVCNVVVFYLNVLFVVLHE